MAAKTPEEILAGNITAARARRKMGQADLAERMQALGYRWARQTAGDVETGKRQLRAGEILGLAYALDTTIGALMRPADDDKLVKLPSGATLQGASVVLSVRGERDGAVEWNGNEPVFTKPWIDAADFAASLRDHPGHWTG